MQARANIAVAAWGSALVHLLLLGAAVAWIAFSGIPENDDFSLRTKLGNPKEIQASGSNFAASREPGEPLHAGEKIQSGSVWWSWQAPADTSDVLVEIELQGAGDSLAGIYRGFAVNQLEQVTSSTNGTLHFSADPGTDYHIAVAGRGADAEGLVNLRIRSFSEADSQQPDPQEAVLLLPDIRIEEKTEERKKPQFVRTSQAEELPQAPGDAAFESDRNSIAASELPPQEGGLENLPTLDGADHSALELRDLNLADGALTPELATTIATIELPIADSGRVAPAQPAPEAEQNPASEAAFQPHATRMKVIGTISHQGAAAVGAAETPLGRYHRQVVSAVEKRWHLERRGKEHGSLKVKAIIRPSGKAESPRIVEKDAGRFLTDHAISSILSAEIPPIPEAVLRGFGGKPYEITFSFYH